MEDLISRQDDFEKKIHAMFDHIWDCERGDRMMDAVKFLKEKNRMCDRYYSTDCKGCPLEPAPEYGGYASCEQFAEEDPDEVVLIVEEWSEKNPILTNAMKFEQVFGTLTPIAKLINESPKYWDREYEEPINVRECQGI